MIALPHLRFTPDKNMAVGHVDAEKMSNPTLATGFADGGVAYDMSSVCMFFAK